MKSVTISGEYITLGQLVKLLNLIGSGGEIREFLFNNHFLINGERDDRRGRKVRIGDTVTLPDGEAVMISARG